MRRSMSLRRAWRLFVGIACCGAGVAIWLALAVDSGDPGEPEPGAERQWTEARREAVEAVIAEVAAASTDGPRKVEIQAAPRRATTANAGVPPINAAAPSPPEGYTFVEHHGEVRAERFQPRREAGKDVPDDGLDWLGSSSSVSRLVGQAASAGRDWSFGWIRMAPDSRLSDVTPLLEALDVVVEGAAGPLVRARLPGDRAGLEAIVALSGVQALGGAPLAAKLPPVFAEQALAEPAHGVVPVFVTLMAEESGGRWGRELERLGAQVGAYDADTRAYVANVEYGLLEDVAEADFVLFVEPVGTVEAAHDTAVPAMGADVHRTYEGEPGSFTGTGGASVPVAVMDTGLNINHLDIVSNRDSICGANFVTPSREEDQDLWADAFGHGTHVTGTIAGNGTATPAYAGMAPLVRDIRFAKVLSFRGAGASTAINAGMDFLSESTECSAGGWSSDLVKPLIVNMSLSANRLTYEGRDQDARKLDAVVWGHRQLYVVAQSNSSIHGFSQYGAAKNSLPVGAALDSGELAGFSSLGPTADGRLAPLVVGTGVGLNSAAGGGSRSDYNSISGTSMASPSVAGVAALLMDAVPSHREHPALARARLMASAVKPDVWFEDAGAFPTDNTSGPGTVNARFGLGKVSARTGILDRDQSDGWTNGSVTAAFEDGEYAYHDIEVPEGTSRLDVVLTWDEPPTDAIANAVLNDLDLWLDQGGDCAEVQCGERSSASRKDNVEWVIVRDPMPGTWRAKVAASRIYTEAPRAALAWTLIRGPATPELAVTADRSTMDGSSELTVTVTVNGYVAAGTRLHLECRALGQSRAAEPAEAIPCVADGNAAVTNADGLVVARGYSAGGFVPLGEIGVGESREVRLESLNIDVASALHLTATAWNATAASISVPGGMDAADEVTAVETPDNDAFAAAETLEGAEGSRQIDMLHATTEPGEPDYVTGSGRPAGSVWYRWKAAAAGPVHFGAVLDEAFRPALDGSTHTLSRNLSQRELRFDVLQGNGIAVGKPVASAPWGASFFALADHEYVVRVSHRERAVRATMHWRQGARPENDAFASATVIGEEAESVAGSNFGATLEPGEYFGGLGGTVWYAWTAPDDGYREFRVSAGQLKVLAFSGEALGDLRLVSGYPDAVVGFPAQSGGSYRIAVASADAFSAGSRFDLSWSAVDRTAGDDDFSGARELAGENEGSWSVAVDGEATVQPGEPADSGVRTRWGIWTAPSAGDHTWRLLANTSGMTLTAFSGDSLETLSALGVGNSANIDFSFSAEAGQAYRLAVGVSARHASAFEQSYLSGTVEFGPTPSNDAWASGTVLAEASGMIAGSNRYATTDAHERIRDVGHSSLWWTFEAPADGWYRFRVDESDPPFTLAAFVHASVPAAQLEMIVSGRPGDGGPAEIVFEAKAGDRFAIRLGTFGSAEGGDFTLHWEETEAPNWLGYLGRFTPETEDSEGRTVEVADLRRMAVDATGQALYVASPTGLSVLARDVDTGALTSAQLLSGDLQYASLLWDRDNTRLLVFNNCQARVYAAVDATFRRLRDAGTLAVSGSSPCISHGAFMDPAGEFVYGFNYSAIRAYEYDGATLRHVQTLDLSALRDAVISNEGQHVYAVADHGLYILERDSETGELTEVDQIPLDDRSNAAAISDDDEYLFTFGRLTAFVHGLEDPAAPRMLGSLIPPTQRYHSDITCRLSLSRNERHAADAFCRNSALAVQWEPSTSQLALADFVSSWQPNRFGERLPAFGWARGVAASPDGRHAYVSTDAHGILIFARVGNPLVEVDTGAEGGYVRLGSLVVSEGRVTFGPLSSSSCITIMDLTVNDILYHVDLSKWQTRPDAAGTWSDVADTATTGEVCAYTPTESGQYRMVVQMDIDGEAGKYASNVIEYEAE